MKKDKWLLCAALMIMILSSCGTVPQETAEPGKTVSTEAAQPSTTAPAESASEGTVQATEAESETDEESVQSTVKAEDEMQIILKIGETAFTVQLEDNETTAAFTALLPMTITMEELHGNEKYFYLDNSLPTDSAVPDRIEAGDVMLFGDRCLVVFYEGFSTSYSYTSIGHITDITGLKDALGSGSVSVEWRTESSKGENLS